jgi:hypothetical protein
VLALPSADWIPSLKGEKELMSQQPPPFCDSGGNQGDVPEILDASAVEKQLWVDILKIQVQSKEVPINFAAQNADSAVLEYRKRFPHS